MTGQVIAGNTNIDVIRRTFQTQNTMSIIKHYFKGIWMALLGKVSENYTYDNEIHCN